MKGCLGQLLGLVGLFVAAFCVIVLVYAARSVRAGEGLPGLAVWTLVGLGILTGLAMCLVAWLSLHRGAGTRRAVALAAAVLAIAGGVVLLPISLPIIAANGWLGAVVPVAAVLLLSAGVWLVQRRTAVPAHHAGSSGVESGRSSAPQRPTPPGPPVQRIERDPPLTDTVIAAVHRAAGPGGRTVTTGRLLTELVRGDALASWERIWLYTGTPEATGLGETPDPPSSGTSADWRGIPVTDAVVHAFWVIDELCWRHRLPGDTALAALALLARSSNGATIALRRGGLTHARLLAVVERDLLGTHLDGLAAVIPAVRD